MEVTKMGFFCKSGDSQSITGNNNKQVIDKSKRIIINHGGGCPYGKYPSIGNCEGSQCPKMWSCAEYNQYLNNITE
jgi:hypothetical protein